MKLTKYICKGKNVKHSVTSNDEQERFCDYPTLSDNTSCGEEKVRDGYVNIGAFLEYSMGTGSDYNEMD